MICWRRALPAWKDRGQIEHVQGSETETNMLAFVIEGEITKGDRYQERMRTAGDGAAVLGTALRTWQIV